MFLMWEMHCFAMYQSVIHNIQYSTYQYILFVICYCICIVYVFLYNTLFCTIYDTTLELGVLGVV